MALHSDLTDPELHEPKGVGTANNDEVYVADGLGSGSWGNPTKLATGWRDLIMPFTASSVGALRAPGFIQIKDDGAGSTGVFGYAFDATTEEELFLTAHIDHDYKLGTAFYPHIHWCPTTTNTGTVRWGIEWTSALRDTQAFGNTTITYLEQAASGTAYQHQVVEIADPGITIPNADTDMLVLIRVFRDAAHANDTYTGDAIGLFLDAHYQIDRYATANKAAPFRDV